MKHTLFLLITLLFMAGCHCLSSTDTILINGCFGGDTCLRYDYHYSGQSLSEEEIEKLKANANRMYQLEERERELTAELANNNELMRKLRENPKFLGASEWKKLEDITNRIYNHFTKRIKSEYPHLTEVDIQLCILLKLRFTVSQIAILTATSPSSVSVQKNRLKKRLLQKDEHLFDNGQTLDMYLWMY